MAIDAALFSSTTDDWSTPQDFYDALDDAFSFTLDPCASRENTKCPLFFTELEDGLAQDWSKHRVFVNPPYSQIAAWMKKAYESSLAGALVVCLIPARTDTRYWHNYAKKGHIGFVKGRLKFGGSKTSAPFPSAVIVFYPPALSYLAGG